MKLDIKGKLSELKESNLNTSWQKAIYWAVVVSLFVFLGANLYLLFRPLSTEIQGIIEDEVKATDVSFDQKTLDNLKNRQNPPESTTATTGKNPFSPF